MSARPTPSLLPFGFLSASPRHYRDDDGTMDGESSSTVREDEERVRAVSRLRARNLPFGGLESV